MQAECTPKLPEFEAVERRSVVAGFDGGNITSNAGALLLGQVDRGLGLVRRFADCFTDRRDPRYVEHQVETLVGQRKFDEAITKMSDVIGRKPDLAYPYFWRGQAYYGKKKADRMVDDFQTFLKLAPKAPEAGVVRQLLSSLG